MNRAFKLARAGRRIGWIAVAGVALVAFAACSTAEPTPTPQPPTATPQPPTATPIPPTEVLSGGGGLEEPEQEWITRTDNEDLRLILATPDLGPGTRRFAMVLTDRSGIVAFPVVRIASYKYPDGSNSDSDREGPKETAIARYFEFPYGTRGIHVTELTFDEVGTWGVEASVPQPDGTVATIEVVMEVHEETMSVDVGEVPPLVDSRTLQDVADVSDLTTGSNRDESLYQISVADALQNGKPTVVVFASPAFCTNAVCGPQVEVLSNLSSTYGDSANFVHVDLFTNPKEIQGDLTRAMKSPLLDEWGLVSQEWSFVMDRNGVVVGRFENFVPQAELEPSLESVLEVAQPEPTPTPLPPTETPVPATATPVPPTATSEPEVSQPESSEPLEFSVTSETTWRELFDQFKGSEQSCIRDGVGDELLESVLDTVILSEDDEEMSQDTVFECLEPETVKAIWLANLLATSEGLTEEGEICVRDLVAETDVKAVVGGDMPGASQEEIAITGEFYGGLFACNLLGMVGDLDAMEGDEACLAELLTNSDMSEIYIGSRSGASTENAAVFQDFMGALFGCMPGLLQAGLDQAANAPQPSQ